jgi:hypothetical protein
VGIGDHDDRRKEVEGCVGTGERRFLEAKQRERERENVC